jgi:REP element-mobilizing transposase RayT
VRHARRQRLSNLPVHVTLRVRRDVWSLRSRRCFQALHRSFVRADRSLGLQLCDFSVQGNHLHFLVEAENTRALSRGMQGLAIRMARALNRVMQRRGKVFADRFHAHVLRTPTEVRNALAYVLRNHAVHAARLGRDTMANADLYSSLGYMLFEFARPEAIGPPRTWLLRRVTVGQGP